MGTPGSARARLSHSARSKLGTSETTMSGGFFFQNSSSSRTALPWKSRITACIPTISCGEPSVHPFFSNRL